jgi:hypothetical protein
MVGDVLLGEQNLSLKIAEFHEVTVDNSQCSYASSHQLIGDDTSQRTTANL